MQVKYNIHPKYCYNVLLIIHVYKLTLGNSFLSHILMTSGRNLLSENFQNQPKFIEFDLNVPSMTWAEKTTQESLLSTIPCNCNKQLQRMFSW